MRFFFAIPLDHQTRECLEAVLRSLAPCFQSGNFSRPENLHVTLAFLGDVPLRRYQAAKDAMECVQAQSFPLRLGGLGCFRREGGDVYWAGVDCTKALSDLQGGLSGELRKRGFVLEDRPYRPHLTLIRRGVLKDGCDRRALDVPQITMPVEKFSLMQSLREGGRLVYRELASKKLEGEGL